MPRNSQGLYTLPAGNPVVPDTIIDAGWANPTMGDVAQALTDSLPRNGAAPMTGQLTLVNSPPTASLHAISKGYADQLFASAAGVPIGAILTYAAGTAPSGYILCDGSPVSRSTYADLFALIGTTYGSGDNVTTFNVPNLVDYFIRGRNATTRPVGSLEAAAFANHVHPITDNGHVHTLSNLTHVHGQAAHTHTVTDPGHAHTIQGEIALYGSPNSSGVWTNTGPTTPTGTATTGITLSSEAPAIGPAVLGGTAESKVTGITLGSMGGADTRPQNMALDFYIKALQDGSGGGGGGTVVAITSSDTNMLAITGTSTNPILTLKSNVALGMVKLNAAGQINPAQIPMSDINYQGPWDATSGQTPSQTYPAATFLDGDMYLISVQGTMTVHTGAGAAAPQLCPVNSNIVYLTGSPTFPTAGWYYNPGQSGGGGGGSAALTTFVPSGSISATNVQTALQEVDSEKAPKVDASFVGTFLVNGMTVGHGPGLSSTNTVVGTNTFIANTTGLQCTAVGEAALQNNSSGEHNTGLGHWAGATNSVGNQNTAVGSNALFYNAAGGGNTAIGVSALYNAVGNYNTAVGWNALAAYTSHEGVAVGYEALQSNQTGLYNTAVGSRSLRANIIGARNTAMGFETLMNVNSDGNTAIGAYALSQSTGVGNNTAVGNMCLANSTSSSLNTAVGSGAMQGQQSGANNIAMGYNALFTNVSGIYNVAMGSQALMMATGSNNTGIGADALKNQSTGAYNTAIGRAACGLGIVTGTFNTAMGWHAMYNLTSGVNNFGLGVSALEANTTGARNTAIGNEALKTSLVANDNVGIGYRALTLNITGIQNVAVGGQGMATCTQGSYNTSLGHLAGSNITTGYGNVTIGGMTSAGVFAPQAAITTQDDFISLGSTAVTEAHVHVAWTVASDLRDKTDFGMVPLGLDFVSKLNPVAYRYRVNRDTVEGAGRVRYGFIAQQVLALEGAGVVIDDSDPEHLRYNEASMLAVVVKALQELKAEFDAYKVAHP